MRQRHTAFVVTVVLGAFALMRMPVGVDTAQAASPCKTSCKPVLNFCKNEAATAFADAKAAFAAAKVSCKELTTKEDQKACLKTAKDTKKAATKEKKDALKGCKNSDKCRQTECKALPKEKQTVCAPLDASPIGAIVSSPADSFLNCLEGSLL